ncbi:Flp family type IVb pilin [Sphingomonas tabacisoli]|uniref:Flp family type IVb pilin n=1 Tax=Sphingomonas tabacisoli TaxID=2249466 RepID=A0ABW4I436_9SPHN
MISEFLHRLLRSAAGATAVEYGLIVSLIVIAMLASLSQVANVTIGMWNNIAQNVLAH